MDKIYCEGIEINQFIKNGMLGSKKDISIPFNYENSEYTIKISQFGFRTITILADKQQKLENIISVFYYLEKLLMLMEGEFLEIKGYKILGYENKTTEQGNDLFKNRLSLYESADFARGRHSKFVEYDSVLSEKMLSSWIKILDELDILHTTVLYFMADTKLPLDIKCAFLIESFETLSELLEKQVGLKIEKDGDRITLKNRLKAIIDKYGQDIFAEELDTNEDEFIKILVNSRNRIAHIKSNQNKICLKAVENLLYTVKFSYLYRHIILNLLGIDYELYKDKILKSVANWNNMDGNYHFNFIKKLKE